MILIDDDTVENHNIGGQFYKVSQIGNLKVAAVRGNISEYSGVNNVETRAMRIDSNFPIREIPPIFICGFDNMVARKTAFSLWKQRIEPLSREERGKFLFVDGRLSLETLQILSFTGADDYYIKKYDLEYLFSDDQADSTQCSAKQTSYMANMIGSLIANVVVAFCYACLPSGLPFMIEYNSDLFGFSVKR